MSGDPRIRTIADAALGYVARGWKPVPVSRKTKKPIEKGWQTRPFAPSQFAGNAQNVAVQLGPVSGDLVDVDLDAIDAIGLATEFLPETDAIFGRRSKPLSHQFYRAEFNGERRAAIQFKHQGAVLVELRIGADGKGAITVVPPSMHASGELVLWERDGEPARVDAELLKRSVTKLAVACLLKQHYPAQGSRHEGALVIGGVLARAGWRPDDIGHVVEVVARGVGDDEWPDRVTAATSAVNVKANGHEVAGLDRMRALWGPDATKTLAGWLSWREVRTKAGAGLEDAVALEFAGTHADAFRYVAASRQWMKFTGCRWEPEDTLGAFDESRLLCRKAGDAQAKTVAAVVTLARSDRRLAATVGQWDAQLMLFNCSGATIDLTTGMPREPDRRDYITKIAGTALAEAATPHPLWDRFLARVTGNDRDLIAFLQRWCGYCLTGHTHEHKLVFLYGKGANGKSVFTSTIGGIIGDYTTVAPIELLLASKHDRHPTEIARLKPARLVLAQETPAGRRWDETKLKSLTSSDPLTGRFMRQDFFDFLPTHKLMVVGNHRPSLANVEEATKRRLLMVPFVIQIPPAERDPHLTHKLKSEWPAILRWAVDGCLAYQRQGLAPPASVIKASDDYFDGEDTLQQWIDDCLKTDDPRAFTPSRQLFMSWKEWAEQRNLRSGSEKEFVERLADKGIEKVRTNKARGFKGVELKPDDSALL